jgi:hypothetical protein
VATRPIKRSKVVSKQCPRCHNNVDMILARERGLLVPLLSKARLLSPYMLKCPICIYVEPLTNQQAYSLMER